MRKLSSKFVATFYDISSIHSCPQKTQYVLLYFIYMNSNNLVCHNTSPLCYTLFHVQKQQFISVAHSYDLHCLSKTSCNAM